MTIQEITIIVSLIVTWVLGYFSKKSKYISNNMIPLQNILIGLIIAIVEFAITKDWSTAVAISGIFAGGMYDVFNNGRKLIKENEDYNATINEAKKIIEKEEK